VRAGDDEDEDDKTFEERSSKASCAASGGTNMENRGIDYRERSPLVVPLSSICRRRPAPRPT